MFGYSQPQYANAARRLGMGIQQPQNRPPRPQGPMAALMSGPGNSETQREIAEALMAQGMNAGAAQSDLEGASNIAAILGGALLSRQASNREAKDRARGDQLLDDAFSMDPTSPKRSAAVMSAARRSGRDELADALMSQQFTPRARTLSPDEVEAAGFAPGSVVQESPDGELEVVQSPQRPGRRQTTLGGDGYQYDLETGERISAIPPRNMNRGRGGRRNDRPTSEGQYRAGLLQRYNTGEILTDEELDYLNRTEETEDYGLEADTGPTYSSRIPPANRRVGAFDDAVYEDDAGRSLPGGDIPASSEDMNAYLDGPQVVRIVARNEREALRQIEMLPPGTAFEWNGETRVRR